MEIIAEFTTRLAKRYQFTLPSTTRKLMAAKGKTVNIGDPVIIQIMEVSNPGEGLETCKDDDISANKPKKDNGGNST